MGISPFDLERDHIKRYIIYSMKRLDFKQRRKLLKDQYCPMCHIKRPFLWTCPCGFMICDVCMQQELWGFTCNNLTWVCPDCGDIRSY